MGIWNNAVTLALDPPQAFRGAAPPLKLDSNTIINIFKCRGVLDYGLGLKC